MPSQPTSYPRGSLRWVVAGLVGGLSLVSYVQRMTISIAAERMMPELALSKSQMGQVFSSFLWGYGLFQVFAGRLGDTRGPRITLALAAILWGILGVLSGLLPGNLLTGGPVILAALLMIRFALGATEAVTYPIGTRAIKNWTRPEEWARGNSFMVAGSSTAAAITSPLVGWIIFHVGWREAFYITSSTAFVVAIVWWFSVTDFPGQHKRISWSELEFISQGRSAEAGRNSSLSKLLKDRNVLLLALTYVSEGYVLFIFVFWLYIYLVEVRGFTMLTGGFAASLPWLTAMFCTPLGGIACDHVSARKGQIAGARATIILGYGFSGVLLFVAAGLANRTAAVTALCISVGALYFAEPAFWTAANYIGGEDAGSVSGIMNTAGILGGIISTSLVPVMVEHFGWIFALGSGAAVALACTLTWLFIGSGTFTLSPHA